MPPKRPRDYEVGYGKPPRHTRFQKGQSGNPRGRPGGSKNLATLLSEALDERVAVVENGRRKRISKREAVIAQLVNQSAKADLRAIKILLDIQRTIDARSERDNPQVTDGPVELGQSDRGIIERYLKRHAGKRTNGK